jgi:hypothetical protein
MNLIYQVIPRSSKASEGPALAATERDWTGNVALATMTGNQGFTLQAGRTMRMRTYDDHGVRFEYPADWALEVTEDGALSTIDLQHPDGVAFVLVSVDLTCPDSGEVADSVLETMREEYPDLDADPTEEIVDDRFISGYDVQFLSLDLSNTARIRCFRTMLRTILVFGQWTDILDADISDLPESIIHAIEETDA